MVPLGVALAVAVVLLAVWTPAWMAVAAACICVAVLVWGYWLIGRQVRATGYALRQDDLLVVTGIMFRRLVIVPYGRMQLVDVE